MLTNYKHNYCVFLKTSESSEYTYTVTYWKYCHNAILYVEYLWKIIEAYYDGVLKISE